MPIRSVDLQVLFPKVPEVQKIKNAENEVYKNNQQINIIQDSIKRKEDLKRINKNDKAYKVNINKDGKNNRGKNQEKSQKKKDKDNKEKEYYKGGKIDIKI
ncbi:hypothetical protein [Lutispora thermophila]|uniref:Uncharacterized protein n=1 Tax=Lutispora thermophila DSM 19022 TaxID=1122184 RepID=A0A1M6G8P2_9FIRM|nr:hypothetical protein [Lutispora thermophila]SHJ06288.1 hypothetical protein SAMN02745176_02290 [Lutispora thermophila DSM 19022]